VLLLLQAENAQEEVKSDQVTARIREALPPALTAGGPGGSRPGATRTRTPPTQS
jgi:hypothetical protein